MRLIIDVSDTKLSHLLQLSPQLGLNHDQIIERAIDDMLNKYWIDTSVSSKKTASQETIDDLLEFSKGRTFGPGMTIKEAKEQGRL